MNEKLTSEGAAVERRRARRFTVDWDVVVRGKDEFGANVNEGGTLWDLSSRGALLSIPLKLRVGMRFELWIRVPSIPERWMAYPAEIVRIDDGGFGVGTATRFLTARPKLHPTLLAGSRPKLEIVRRR